jgi:glutaredoxin
MTVHHPTQLYGMKRPILDRLASFVFKLENDRVTNASVLDEKGRSGEPMEWAEENSFANQLSQIVSNNDIGYTFKQTVADLVAGQYDREARAKSITSFIEENSVAMYSFTTCPFCRKAKDYLDENSIPYSSIELDLLPGNEGNEIRSELGRMTKRTSVPSIFIGGER